jgi:endonuclease/exonuclease/phosphatase family metal-dependent hydrolase
MPQQHETVNGAFVHDDRDHDATADVSSDSCRETETMPEREVASVSPERALRSVRAVTQNLWGRRGAWPERRAVLVAGLRKLHPDLIAFQEAIKNEEYGQARDLLGPDYHVLHSSKREPGDGGDVEAGQGISIASRWPFRAAQELELPVTPRMAESVRASLMVEVHAPGPIGPLLFVNHNPSWQLRFEYERELQAVAVAQELEGRVGRQPMHAVLAGDLNADPEAASMRFLTGRQALEGTSVCYRDAWESAHPDESGATTTFDNPLVADWDWPFRRIDHILVRCGEHGGPTLAISRCDRTFDRPVNGVWASDHFGLVADLEAPPK